MELFLLYQDIRDCHNDFTVKYTPKVLSHLMIHFCQAEYRIVGSYIISDNIAGYYINLPYSELRRWSCFSDNKEVRQGELYWNSRKFTLLSRQFVEIYSGPTANANIHNEPIKSFQLNWTNNQNSTCSFATHWEIQ